MTSSNPAPHNYPDGICAIATEYSSLLTGDWRALRPVVDRDRCVKCATCWLYCPVQCMVEHSAWFDVNYDTCKGCGICAEECPHRAITMIKETE